MTRYRTRTPATGKRRLHRRRWRQPDGKKPTRDELIQAASDEAQLSGKSLTAIRKHVLNVLLHLIVVTCVIVLGRQLGGGWGGGLLAGALIGLHALNANTVTWVAGRVSLLGVAFALIATVAFLQGLR